MLKEAERLQAENKQLKEELAKLRLEKRVYTRQIGELQDALVETTNRLGDVEKQLRMSGGPPKAIVQQAPQKTLKSLLRDALRKHKGAIGATLALGALGGLGGYYLGKRK